MKLIEQSFQVTLTLILAMLVLVSSGMPPAESADQVRHFTRTMEFDYISWTADALLLKLGQAALNAPRYLTIDEQRSVIKNYLKLVKDSDDADYQIERIYADPKMSDKAAGLQPWQEKQQVLRRQRAVLGPVAEEIIQKEISEVLSDFGLAVGGQPLPPVLYHVTPLPYALIISPRSVIREDNNISLDPNVTLDQMVGLEKSVETGQDTSALVTPIGGIGIYPTMVMSTSDLPWMLETVAHEWTHNYLTLRPLGLNYFTTPALRTMNETTANLVGKDVGQELVRRYFPEYFPKPTPTPVPTPQGGKPTPALTAQPAQFNFNKEMRITRVQTDALLKEGKISEAEAFMEARRQVFWDNGYLIRRLNQAYFAFNGAYADSPGGGAAGEDPVGPAVLTLRKQSSSLAEFLNRISRMTSFEELQKAIQ